MNITSIDWNKVWLEQRKKNPRKQYTSEYWNKRAPSFAEHTNKSEYADKFIKIIKPNRTWTALDMGSGSGTLAIPLASRLKEVTAVDFSDNMLRILQENAEKKKLKNIKTIRASWDDNWNKLDIGLHDIVIASRSLAVDDLRGAIVKLNNAARKRVFISTVAGDGPHDRRIFQAIGREFYPPVDYIFVNNLLYQMGIYANIIFITNKSDRIYDSHKTALDSFTWMINDMTRKEKEMLSGFLDEHLVPYKGKWILNYKKTVRWAVLWWDKDASDISILPSKF